MTFDWSWPVVLSAIEWFLLAMSLGAIYVRIAMDRPPENDVRNDKKRRRMGVGEALLWLLGIGMLLWNIFHPHIRIG